MKKFVIALFMLAAWPVFAAAQYEFITGRPGYSNGSLNILEDLSSLTLHSDFGSVGNSGAVGYYVYTDNPRDAVIGASTFRKGDGAIVLPDLKAGEKVGFFLVRNNGVTISRFNFFRSGDNYFLAFIKNGYGHDEWMFLSSISAEGIPAASGQPLPGVPVSLAVGAAALLILRKFRSGRKIAG